MDEDDDADGDDDGGGVWDGGRDDDVPMVWWATVTLWVATCVAAMVLCLCSERGIQNNYKQMRKPIPILHAPMHNPQPTTKHNHNQPNLQANRQGRKQKQTGK